MNKAVIRDPNFTSPACGNQAKTRGGGQKFEDLTFFQKNTTNCNLIRWGENAENLEGIG